VVVLIGDPPMSRSTLALADSMLVDTAGKLGQVVVALAGFLGILLLVFFLAARATGRAQTPVTIAVFLGPALMLLLVGLVVPAMQTIILSVKSNDSTGFVGSENYEWAFTTEAIHQVLGNTASWIVIVPLLTTVFGLVLAVLIDRLKRQAIYRSLIFMPMAISFVGASFIWRFVYESRDPGLPQIGLLSQIAIGLGWEHPPNWILSHPLNNFLLMVIMIWVQTGFAMVVLSAAIKAIPDEIVEAARVDGARGTNLLVHVTMPLIRNTLIVVLTTVMIITLKVFDIIRTMTGGNYGTQVLANEMYSQRFVLFDAGRGAALAVILFVAVLPLVGYNIAQLRKERATR
jgi:alpha-glucoside transport system permease protein